MPPDDRLHIEPSLVRQLVADQFPEWRDLLIQRVDADGWDNSTFRLGDKMKVRLPTAERYVPQVEKEHRWLPRLAPLLPSPIPQPLALGAPGCGYPFPWAIYNWLDGEPANFSRVDDEHRLAVDLATFLLALQRVPTAGGPVPGSDNFFRGGSLAVYDSETRQHLALLANRIDVQAATKVWDTALASTYDRPPVWVHGDFAAGNLLIQNGHLSAVIDFGGCAVGDPACDLTIAWTLLRGEARELFRTTLKADEGMWARARGWAVWKAMLILASEMVACGDTADTQALIEVILAEGNVTADNAEDV